MIPYGRQDISEADIQAVVDVLRSDFITQGPTVPAFEQAVAEYCGVENAVAVNSGTSALHIACLALGVSPGDWVWTSPITFVASANCALYCGAQVDFVDIDSRTYNLSVERLEQKLKQAETEGKLPKVVIAVHLAGQPCEMQAVHELSEKYGFRIIEDASHAIGAKYQAEPVGNCRFSDIVVFSFHPVKVVTTGEGGMSLTNSSDLARQMRSLRAHGITRNDDEMSQVPDGPWYYEQRTLGFNYRMTDIQAALGLSQIKRLQDFVNRRREIADSYDAMLEALPLRRPWQHPDGESSWHLYIVRLQLNELEGTHREVFEGLRASGIGVNLHYIPVYRQPLYRCLGIPLSQYPEAEQYYAEAISLPLFPGLNKEQTRRVVSALQEQLAV